MPDDHLAVPQLELSRLAGQTLHPVQELVSGHLVSRHGYHGDGIPYVCGTVQLCLRRRVPMPDVMQAIGVKVRAEVGGTVSADHRPTPTLE
jgi:hypothetical protein